MHDAVPAMLPLPREIVCFIAEYLSPHDRASLANTCKEIHRTIDHILWTDVTLFSEDGCLSLMDALQKEPSRKQGIKTLEYGVDFKSVCAKRTPGRISTRSSGDNPSSHDERRNTFELSHLQMLENLEEIIVRVNGWLPPWHKRYPTRDDWMVSINMWDDQSTLSTSFDSALRLDADPASLICDRSMLSLKSCYLDFGVVNLGPTACWSFFKVARILLHPTIKSLFIANAHFIRTPFQLPPGVEGSTPLEELTFRNCQVHMPYTKQILRLPRKLKYFSCDMTRGSMPVRRDEWISRLLTYLQRYAPDLTHLHLPCLNECDSEWRETVHIDLSRFERLHTLELDSATNIEHFPPSLSTLILYMWGSFTQPRVQYVWGATPDPSMLCPIFYDVNEGPKDLAGLKARLPSLKKIVLVTPDKGFAVPGDLRKALGDSDFDFSVEHREFRAPIPSYYKHQ